MIAISDVCDASLTDIQPSEPQSKAICVAAAALCLIRIVYSVRVLVQRYFCLFSPYVAVK